MKKPLFIAICLLLFSCLSISLFAQSLTSGLVSVWEFNETSGTSVADAYGSNNGTVNGATINQVGKIGQCIQFNGTSSYVSIPNSASLNPNSQDFSVNAWVKWEGSALSGAVAIFMAKGEYVSSGSEFQFTLRGGGGADYKNGFYFRLRTSDGTLNTIGCTTDQTSIVGNGSWHMLTAVVDEGSSVEGRIFLDGTEVGSLASITALVNNTSDLHFGEYANATYFPGKIDQPAVWNRALTASEIQTLYNSGNGLVYSQSASTLNGGTITIGTSAVSLGSSPGSFTSLAAASGGTGSYAYQWQQSSDNITWTSIGGQTAATYTVPTLTTMTYYRRMVTSGSYTGYSNAIKIVVILSGGTISIGTTSVASGSSPGTFANASSPSGGTGSFNYRWEQSTDNSTWTNIPSESAATCTVPALTASTYFRRMVLSGGYFAYSNTVLITVTTATLSGGTISIGTSSVSPGSSPGTFTSSAAASGGTGSYSYQWQQSADNSTWTTISGQTAANYTVPGLTTTTYYRRMVTSGSYTAYSNTVTITVTATLSGGTISIGTSSVSPGSSPGTFTSSAAASGGTGSYSYQWQQSADNSTWTNISGQTAATYTVPALTTTTYYRRMVTSGSYTAYSNTVTITITLSGGTISIGTTSVSSGSSPGSFTSSAAASGGTGSYSYQWQQSADNSTWTTISGQTAANYTVTGLTTTTYYRRMVTSGSYTAYSNTVTITVTATLSGGTISIGTSSVSSGSSPGTFTSSAAASGGTGSFSYQWQQSADNSTWIAISGQTAATYTVPGLTTTTYYRRMVTSGSYTAYSNTVTITVTATLSGGTISIGTSSVSSGSSPGTFTSSAAASGGTGTYSYQWQQSSDNTNWNTISGATATTYTVPSLTAATYYRRMVSSGSATAYSNTVAITVNSSGGAVTSVNGLTGAVSLGLAISGYTLSISGGNSVTLPSSGGSSQWTTNSNGSIQFSAGNVGIGSSTSGIARNLLVNGNIYAKEILVSTTISAPDYVFEKGYRVLPLDELNQYLETHKHLPEIPSAKEMETDGVELSKMNLLLLKKVEEMTLYIIQLEKRVKDLEK